MNRNEISVGTRVLLGNVKVNRRVKVPEWTVLEIDGDKALLLCDSLICEKPFNDEEGETDWESCTLRKWLNTTFIKDAFSDTEAEYIEAMPLSDNKSCIDSIFILSGEETEKYLNSEESRTEGGLCYIPQRAVLKLGSNKKDGDEYWWVRTVASFDPRFGSFIKHVDSNGFYGATPSYCNRRIRPAMYFNLDGAELLGRA